MAALAGYAALAFLFSAGAWGNPTTTWPGDSGDPFKFMDWLAWVPHALSQHQNPLFTTAVDYPRGVNLAWEQTMPLAAVTVWPLTAVFGPVAAYNAWFVIALTLNGWCTYLWLRRHVRHSAAAFLGGIAVAGGPYVAAHALDHLNLISFFPIPLMFIAVEEIVARRAMSWRWGAALGLLAAAQLYLAEEPFAVAAIGVVMALAVLTVSRRREAVRLLRGVAGSVLFAVAIVAVVAGPMLAFQLHGPLVVRSSIQPYNLYVADLQNLIVPTDSTLVRSPQLSSRLAAAWTGNVIEQTAYIGIPMLLTAVYAAVRWWRLLIVRCVAVATLALVVLSLGPHLHVGGVDTGVRLPALLFAHVPVLANVLPVRFSLAFDFGLALLLAVTLDRTLLSSPRRALAGSVLGAFSIVALFPTVPLRASSTSVPQYFSSTGDSRRLPSGTAALVLPLVVDGATTPVAMLWQASADFHVSMVGGLAITVDDSGRPVFVLPGPLQDIFRGVELTQQPLPETAAVRASVLDALRADGVALIIAGPTRSEARLVEFVTWLTGSAPRDEQGVHLWALGA